MSFYYKTYLIEKKLFYMNIKKIFYIPHRAHIRSIFFLVRGKWCVRKNMFLQHFKQNVNII